MARDWNPNIADVDELGINSAISNPLAKYGLTADQVQRNPDLLSQNTLPRANDQAEAAQRTASGEQRAVTSPVAPPPPNEPPPVTARDRAMEGIGILKQNADMATSAAGEIPLNNPNVDRLAAQRERFHPIPLYDSQTGKMLKQTQVLDPITGEQVTINPSPSKKERIWRGVRGGLLGFATGGFPGMARGVLDPAMTPGGQNYGAPSPAYQHAAQMQGEELAATDANLKTSFENWKEQQGAADKRAAKHVAIGALGKDETTGATTLMKRDQTSPEGKAAVTEAEFDEYSKQADRLGLKNYMRAQYIGNKGKLPEPRQATEADFNAVSYNRALAAYNLQRGKPANTPPATLEDFNALQESARGTMNKGKQGGPTAQQETAANDKKSRAIATANAAYAKNFNTQEYQTNLQAAQNAFEQDAQIIGAAGPHVTVTVDNHGHVTWTPEATPAATPVAAPAPPATQNDTPTTPRPPGATGVIRGKSDQKLYWWDGKKKLGVAQ